MANAPGHTGTNGGAQHPEPPAGDGWLDADTRANIRILLIDDESTLRDTCASVLRLQGFQVSSCGRGEEALDTLRRQLFDIVLIDLYMTQVPGMDLLKAALEKKPDTVVIIMTGNPSVASNLGALEAGAWDYLPKPFSAGHLEVMIGRAAYAVATARQLKARRDELEKDHGHSDQVTVLGSSPAFREAMELARRVAHSNASVFITGESGTGKELIAQFIHHNSRRAEDPMMAVNCAALPEPLLESEMFGHYKGAFTGAVRDKPGLFETANGGTMFLDEVTEMSLPIQAKLLRVIQDGIVRRVGSNQVDAVVDVRFIAATNRDAAEAVRQGSLRQDLYYRLRVVSIRVPPLRERIEDIPVLANHFLSHYWQRDHKRKALPKFTTDTIRALQAYPWPGNVRELQNVIEHAVVLVEPGQEISPSDIPFLGDSLIPGGSNGSAPHTYFDEEYHVARERVLGEFERGYLTSLVTRADGNMSRAARMAGVDRTTLYRLIEKHDLERETIIRSK